MNGVQSTDYNGASRKLVSARCYAIHLCSAPWLESGIVQALRFFHELVQEGKAVGKLGRPFGVLGYSSVYELLEKAILVAFIDAQSSRCQLAVTSPGALVVILNVLTYE